MTVAHPPFNAGNFRKEGQPNTGGPFLEAPVDAAVASDSPAAAEAAVAPPAATAAETEPGRKSHRTARIVGAAALALLFAGATGGVVHALDSHANRSDGPGSNRRLSPPAAAPLAPRTTAPDSDNYSHALQDTPTPQPTPYFEGDVSKLPPKLDPSYVCHAISSLYPARALAIGQPQVSQCVPPNADTLQASFFDNARLITGGVWTDAQRPGNFYYISVYYDPDHRVPQIEFSGLGQQTNPWQTFDVAAQRPNSSEVDHFLGAENTRTGGVIVVDGSYVLETNASVGPQDGAAASPRSLTQGVFQLLRPGFVAAENNG